MEEDQDEDDVFAAIPVHFKDWISGLPDIDDKETPPFEKKMKKS
ncbi:hypothetical protein CCACVL1_22801 [Corchorus capsularis]|uniref:Uncharacterized protein n=1 Tax=Corchorus capsularis TaxID=210143 RepID=A0A1R3GWJ5_COCAP|nr:hypothetical protein CCACVL1_22801 [Corchorus capsularis]